jgi:hypothetical protein
MGRYPFTRFNYDSGYEYYYYPTEAGHFYDYLAAVLGADQHGRRWCAASTCRRTSCRYSLPYYLVFDPAARRHRSAPIWMRPRAGLGSGAGHRAGRRDGLPPAEPRSSSATATSTRSRAMQRGRQQHPRGPDGRQSPSIRPYHSWSQRLYPMLYGMALVQRATTALQFVDSNYRSSASATASRSTLAIALRSSPAPTRPWGTPTGPRTAPAPRARAPRT